MAIQHAWRVDPSQSKISFKVSYMLLGVITGEFRHYSGTVLADDTFDELKVTVIVEVGSMTTFHPQRDAGMRSSALFDAEIFPVIKFVSSSCRLVSTGGLFELSGLLTIRMESVPMMMMASLASFSPGGGADSPASAVFTFSGMLRRSAFGLGGKDTPDQDSVADLVEFSGEATIRQSSGKENGI